MTRVQADAVARRLWGEQGGAWNLRRSYGDPGDLFPRYQVGEALAVPRSRGAVPERAVHGMSNIGYLDAFREAADHMSASLRPAFFRRLATARRRVIR